MTEIWTGSGVKIATGWTKKSCDGNNPPVKGVNRFGWKANGTTILTGKRKVGGAIKAFVLERLCSEAVQRYGEGFSAIVMPFGGSTLPVVKVGSGSP